MATQNIASYVSNFISDAKMLESRRDILARMVTEAMKTDVVPKVTEQLPKGYKVESIEIVGLRDESTPSTMGRLAHGTVPTGFDVHLVLAYDGQTVDNGAITLHGMTEIIKIQSSLRPLLEEMAQRYHLNSITPIEKQEQTP